MKYQRSDQDLMRGLVAGDYNSFEEIYRLYHKIVYTVALRYLFDIEIAKDVVQHVFMQLWSKRHGIDPKRNLKNLLFTIAKNHIYNMFRDRNREVCWAAMREQLGGESENVIEQQLMEQEDMQHLYSAIAKLPEQKRAVCMLKLRGEMSNQEIADEMGISINTVKTHYAQSLRLLKDLLKFVIYFTFTSSF